MKKKNRTLFLTFPLLVLVAILLFVVKQPIAQTDTPTELSNSDQVQAIIERGVLRVGVKQDVPNFGYKNPDSGEFEGLEIDIARKIADELGVDIIEAGFPAASNGDFEAVKAIAKEIKNSVIAGLCRANKNDIDRCWEAVKHAVKPRIHTFIATSEIHMKHKLKMTKEEVKAKAIEMAT